MNVTPQNTSAEEVFDSFESSFADNEIIDRDLELYWLKKAVGKFSLELDPLNFNEDSMEFDCKLEQYVIDTLGGMMKIMYQEREVSRVNKQMSIVTKDISVDGAGHTKSAAKNELDDCKEENGSLVFHQMPTAYS